MIFLNGILLIYGPFNLAILFPGNISINPIFENRFCICKNSLSMALQVDVGPEGNVRGALYPRVVKTA
jgi:hypothetical protein